MIVFKNTKSEKSNNQDHLVFAFICDSRMNYYTHEYKSFHIKNGSTDKIIYGINDRQGGCVCEMIMVWYEVDGKKAPRLEVFSDYFDEFTKEWHIEIMRHVGMLNKKEFTPDDFLKILIKLGFEDMSDTKLH